jgi:hypothetical protein
MSEPGTVTCDALPMRVVFGAGALGSSPSRSAAPARAGYRSCSTSCPTSSAAAAPDADSARRRALDADAALAVDRLFTALGPGASLRDLGIPEDGIETVANWRPEVPMPTRGRLARERDAPSCARGPSPGRRRASLTEGTW